MASIQVNIRAPRKLVDEIAQVAALLNVERMDWIRITLAREALEERARLQRLFEDPFAEAKQQAREEIEHEIRRLEVQLREYRKILNAMEP